MLTLTPTDYQTVIRRDLYGNGETAWIAEHPELPGCLSYGSTPDEARDNLARTREAYLEHLREEGIETPPPGGTHSGMFANAPWNGVNADASVSHYV